MAYCLKCGAQLGEGAEYCSDCGAPQKPSGAPAFQPYTQPSPAKRDKTLILIVIAIIVIVVVAAIGSILVLNAFRQAADNKVSMTVNSITDPYNDSSTSPSSSHHFVLLNVTLQNAPNMGFSLGHYSLNVEYEYQNSTQTAQAIRLDDTSLPSLMHSEEKVTFDIGYEVPDGALPKKIIFQGILVSGEAPIT